MSKIKLFCFPHAGGAASAFSSWKRRLDHRIELRPMELPGRGKRFSEKLILDFVRRTRRTEPDVSDTLAGTGCSSLRSAGTIKVSA